MDSPLLQHAEDHSQNGENASSPRLVSDVSGNLTESGDVDVHADPETGGWQDAKHHAAPLTGWGITTFILLADMLGLGSLTLPGDLARLGWITGIGSILLAGLGMMYTGVLFTRLAVSQPRTGKFDDWGSAAYGRAGRIAVYIMVYGAIMGEPTVFQITCVESIKQIVGSIWGKGMITNLGAGLLIAVVMWPLAQLQGLEELGWISIGGTVGMLVALGVVVFRFAVQDNNSQGTPALITQGCVHAYNSSVTEGCVHAYNSSTVLTPAVVAAGGNYSSVAVAYNRNTSVSEKLVALMDVVFAFGGQINWMRYLSVMHTPAHFSKRPVPIAGTFMLCAFITTAAVCYQKLGSDFDQSVPITSLLPQDGWAIIANLGLLVHCIIAYQINLNVWTAMILNLLGCGHVLRYPGLTRSRMLWLLVSTGGLLLAFGIVVAALGDVGGSYVLPLLFSLKLVPHKMHGVELFVVQWALVPLTIAMTGLGLWSSISVLIAQYRGG